MCVLIFFMEKWTKKNRERERYLTAINWPHVAPPCLSVSLSILGVGREPAVHAELREGNSGSMALVCVAVDPGLLVGQMGGEIKDYPL